MMSQWYGAYINQVIPHDSTATALSNVMLIIIGRSRVIPFVFGFIGKYYRYRMIQRLICYVIDVMWCSIFQVYNVCKRVSVELVTIKNRNK